MIRPAIAALTALLTALSLPALADEPSPVDRTVAALERGAQSAANGIERGARAAVRGIEIGLSAAERGVRRGAEATANAVEKAVNKVTGEPGKQSQS